MMKKNAIDAIIIPHDQLGERGICTHGYYFISCKICSPNRIIEANEIVIDLESSTDKEELIDVVEYTGKKYTVKRGRKRLSSDDEDYIPEQNLRKKTKIK